MNTEPLNYEGSLTMRLEAVRVEIIDVLEDLSTARLLLVHPRVGHGVPCADQVPLQKPAQAHSSEDRWRVTTLFLMLV